MTVNMPSDETPTGAAVEARLLKIVAELLDIDADALDPEAKFRSFGMDSILAAELIEEIKSEFDVNVRVSAVYEYETSRLLAQHLAASSRNEG
ncbi:acyl carrier protein [Streptomyces chartreusis]|uniref:acyl carrier protein n=1 Tax=Streptomyces chartreusis TaxID=1969 RepID=UPI00380E5C3B